MKELPSVQNNGIVTDHEKGITTASTKSYVCTNEEVEDDTEYYDDEYIDELLQELIEKEVAIKHMSELLKYYRNLYKKMNIIVDSKASAATDYWIDMTEDSDYETIEEDE